MRAFFKIRFSRAVVRLRVILSSGSPVLRYLRLALFRSLTMSSHSEFQKGSGYLRFRELDLWTDVSAALIIWLLNSCTSESISSSRLYLGLLVRVLYWDQSALLKLYLRLLLLGVSDTSSICIG